ncbi:ABC-type branched-subunit amino acid transport system substrate-binding protein [Bradyrhizobium sp. JR1.5]|uniref:ABC transporter substrate-binding protein n=1 Tax=unclassified Bradyrhizobium TaxID=2631580 RepID=UPI0033950A48
MSILPVHRLATAALLSSILSSSAWAKDAYIAVAGPMMEITAALVAQIRDGASAAVDSINASRLLPDTKLALRTSDDAWDPKQAVAVANRFTTDGIKLVFGHFCSSSSIPASDIYAEAKVLQISPGSTNLLVPRHGLLQVRQSPPFGRRQMAQVRRAWGLPLPFARSAIAITLIEARSVTPAVQHRFAHCSAWS